MSTDDGSPTDKTPPQRPRAPRVKPPKLRAVPPQSQENSDEAPRQKAKPGTFARGNRAGRGSLITQLGTIRYVQVVAVDAIERLRKRQYDLVERRDNSNNLVRNPDGSIAMRRVLKPIGPATGNAVANLARLLMDQHAQYEAGEEMRQMAAEVEELREIVIQMRQQAGAA